MKRRPISLSEIADAAERLPPAERLLLLERLVRSLRRDLAGGAPSPPAPPAGVQVAPAAVEAPLDDDELQELIAETLFEDFA